GGGCSGGNRVARPFPAIPPALLHERLAREEPALAVLVVDEREPALIRGERLLAPPGLEDVEDGPEALPVRHTAHAPGRAGPEVRIHRDRLLAVPRSLDRGTAEPDQLA